MIRNDLRKLERRVERIDKRVAHIEHLLEEIETNFHLWVKYK
ncbi:MAG: hypothetical protein ACYTEQ_24830 [Planctomycetota bacterium]